MAVSQTFALDRLSAQIRLCRFALLAAGTQTVFMREIGSTLFFTALERRVSLAPYLCEDVIRVMDEDATRGSALSRSLYAYLLNFMDLKKAAQQLGIHRNTLEYQVRKMNAVIGGQPDEQKRFMMMCTYKMLALPDAACRNCKILQTREREKRPIDRKNRKKFHKTACVRRMNVIYFHQHKKAICKKLQKTNGVGRIQEWLKSVQWS